MISVLYLKDVLFKADGNNIKVDKIIIIMSERSWKNPIMLLLNTLYVPKIKVNVGKYNQVHQVTLQVKSFTGKRNCFDELECHPP